MDEDVQVFYEADGHKRTFIFQLPESSITLQLNNTEAGIEQGSLLISNFKDLIVRAMEGLK